MVSRTCVWFSTCTLKFTPSTPSTCWRGARTYRRVRESCTGPGRLNNVSIFFYHSSRLSPVMDCTSPATSGYICRNRKNENQMSVCVCKLICNLCTEHCMLENSCVTASFPFLSSLLFFLFSISFPHWAISHTAGCVAASAPPHADVPGSADGQHPGLCLLLRYQLFLFESHFLSPSTTLARRKSGLQMTRLDRGEMANTPRQLERVMVRTSKEMCRLIWRRVYVDSCAGATGVDRAANCGNIQRSYEYV